MHFFQVSRSAGHNGKTRLRRLIAITITAVLCACSTSPEKDAQEPELTLAERNIRAAEELSRTYDTELALHKIKLAIEQDPLLPDAWGVAADIYAGNGQYELADKYYRHALELAPDDDKWLLRYGTFLCRDGRYELAESTLVRAADSPSSQVRGVAYTNAGLCATKIPDPPRAAQYFRAAMEADPGLAVPYFQMARLNFDRKRYPQAQRDFQDYTQRTRANDKVLLLGARIEHALGNRDEFEHYAGMLEQQFPKSPLTREVQTLRKQSFPKPAAAKPLPARPATNPTTVGQSELHRELWIMTREPAHYTVRLQRSGSSSGLPRSQDAPQLKGPFAYYQTMSDGHLRYTLLYGDFVSRAQAEQALDAVPAALRGEQPAVVQFTTVHEEIRGAH
jgi:type IV pilus assembly protein PilF